MLLCRELGRYREDTDLIVTDHNRLAAPERRDGIGESMPRARVGLQYRAFAECGVCNYPVLAHARLLAPMHHKTRRRSRQQSYSTSPMRARGRGPETRRSRFDFREASVYLANVSCLHSIANRFSAGSLVDRDFTDA